MWRTVNRKILILVIPSTNSKHVFCISNCIFYRCQSIIISYNFFISQLLDWDCYGVFESTDSLASTHCTTAIVNVVSTVCRAMNASSIVVIYVIIHVYYRFSITTSILIRHLLNNIWRHLLMFSLMLTIYRCWWQVLLILLVLTNGFLIRNRDYFLIRFLF